MKIHPKMRTSLLVSVGEYELKAQEFIDLFGLAHDLRERAWKCKLNEQPFYLLVYLGNGNLSLYRSGKIRISGEIDFDKFDFFSGVVEKYIKKGVD